MTIDDTKTCVTCKHYEVRPRLTVGRSDSWCLKADQNAYDERREGACGEAAVRWEEKTPT